MIPLVSALPVQVKFLLSIAIKMLLIFTADMVFGSTKFSRIKINKQLNL